LIKISQSELVYKNNLENYYRIIEEEIEKKKNDVDEAMHILEATRDELTESENRFADVVNNFPGIIFQWYVDSDDKSEFKYIGGKVKEILEIDIDSLRKDVSILLKKIYSRDRSKLLLRLRHLFRCSGSLDYKLRIITEDNKTRWLHIFFHSIKNIDNSVKLNGIIIDITEVKKSEEKLLQSQRFIQQMADTIPDVIYIFDLESRRFLYTNKKFLKEEMNNVIDNIISGIYNENGLVRVKSDILKRYIYEEDIPKLEEFINYIYSNVQLEKNYYYELEFRINTSDGGYKWISTRNNVFKRGADGRPHHIIGLSQDISERKRIEEEQSIVKLIIETSNNMLFRWDNKPNWPVIYVTDNVSRILGYSGEDLLLGKVRYSEILHPEDIGRIKEEIAYYHSNKIRYYEHEYRLICKDGSVKWFEDRTSVILNSLGEVMYYQGILIDITERKNSEMKIQRSLKEITNLKFALDQSAVVNIVDTDFNIIYVNDKYCEATQYTRDYLIGKQYKIDEADEATNDMIETIKRGDIWKGELMLKRKEGGELWFYTTVIPLKDDEGKVYQYITIRFDITDRKIAELNLRKSYKVISDFKQALDEAAIVSMTDKQGKIIYVNRKLCDISGYFKQEIEGRNHNIFNSGYHGKDFFVNLWETILSGRVWKGEILNKTKDGGFFWADTTIVPFLDDSGIPFQFIAIRFDITERKMFEERLRKSEQDLIEAQKIAKVGSFEVDMKNRVIMLSSVAMMILETTDGIILLDDYISRIYKRDIINFRRVVNVVTKEPKEMELEYRIFVKNNNSSNNCQNNIKYVLCKVKSIFEKGVLLKIIGTIQDITDRKNFERELIRAKDIAENAARSKAEFLAMMSHEIRTPLNGVLGMADLLTNTKLNVEQEEYVETIKQAGSSLLTILNDILDFSKIEAKSMELEMNMFDIHKCIDETVTLFTSKAIEKKIEILSYIEPSIPETLIGDETRIKQIIVNLLSNAVKFTERGEVILSVTMLSQKNNYVDLRFSVKDTGIGIPKEMIGKLFTPFTQGDSSTSRKYGGTGLGLSICYKLVELMNGKIGVTSQVGEGSEFYFRIKLKVSDIQNTYKVDEYKLSKLRELNILLVESNVSSEIILSKIFGEMGLNVSTVNISNNNNINDLLNKGKLYDVYLLNMIYRMNDLKNICDSINEFHRGNANIIMMLYIGQNHLFKSLKDGYKLKGYITKPIKRKEFIDVIYSILYDNNSFYKKDEKKYQNIDKLSKHIPLRILVAEDNLINQKLIIRVLENMGYSGEIANNGLEVLEKVKKNNYDIIFMDIQMPEMDGIEATRYINENIEQKNRPYVIAMTANVMQEDRDRCMEAGMIDFIGKPFKLEEIKEVILKYGINKKQL